MDFDYQPTTCTRPYRVVALKKHLSVERGEPVLFDDIRYFFDITNDRALSCHEVVHEARQRCDQENLIAQLKGGVRALHAPVNTLHANWAYQPVVKVPRRTESRRRQRRARLARRDEGEYRQYLTEKQRSQAGCSAGRMPWDFHHGLL